MKDKAQLRHEFNKFLGDKFDAQNKLSDGQSNRYIFCNDGMETYEECACNICDSEIKDCNCVCHERIEQIVNFFWNKLRRKK